MNDQTNVPKASTLTLQIYLVRARSHGCKKKKLLHKQFHNKYFISKKTQFKRFITPEKANKACEQPMKALWVRLLPALALACIIGLM
jgi:hypothetical protein